jgi:hypothetical protein
MIVETAAILVVSEFEHGAPSIYGARRYSASPTWLRVEFVALGPERSRVAVYSRSRYGGYDFAKNGKRVE